MDLVKTAHPPKIRWIGLLKSAWMNRLEQNQRGSRHQVSRLAFDTVAYGCTKVSIFFEGLPTVTEEESRLDCCWSINGHWEIDVIDGIDISKRLNHFEHVRINLKERYEWKFSSYLVEKRWGFKKIQNKLRNLLHLLAHPLVWAFKIQNTISAYKISECSNLRNSEF